MMSGLLRVFVGVDAYVRLPTLELDNWYYVCLFIGKEDTGRCRCCSGDGVWQDWEFASVEEFRTLDEAIQNLRTRLQR